MLHASPTIKLDLFVRKLVLTRLDTIGFGLAGAYIHWYYKSLWEKFKNIFFIIGLIAIVFIINTDMQRTFFFQTFYYSLIGLSILFILPKLESIKNENIPLKPFQFLSKISYSMYLLHLPLLHVMSYIFKPSNKTEALVMYMVFWVFNVLFSYLIYKIYEVPMMNLRDRKQNSIPLI